MASPLFFLFTQPFLEYGINSILFQRGIYPAEDFDNTQHYGLTILMSKDPKITTFLQNVLSQTEGNERLNFRKVDWTIIL